MEKIRNSINHFSRNLIIKSNDEENKANEGPNDFDGPPLVRTVFASIGLIGYCTLLMITLTYCEKDFLYLGFLTNMKVIPLPFIDDSIY